MSKKPVVAIYPGTFDPVTNGHLDVIGRAFKWSRDETKAELANVHLSNLPEQLAFFSGDIAEAGKRTVGTREMGDAVLAAL